MQLTHKNIGVDALYCLLTEKIDDELLDAAGRLDTDLGRG